ncbi:MAG: FecR domain-containing protein [Thiotrichales bacterium]|nr:MAG: FecR domain-containing protein [Thiotrichales bacterium]
MLHGSFKHFLLVSTILALIFSCRSLAEDIRGEVIGVDGQVYIIDAEGEREEVEQPSVIVREMDTIVTAEGGYAIVRFSDGAFSVLNEKSRLRVEKTNWLSHLGGRIYFTFSKVFSGSRHIKTRFATLGIRGTTFIVYDDGSRQGVALDEGLLEIESPGASFEIHKQEQLKEFETFRQQVLQQQRELQQEYEDYKKQLEQEFIEYRDRFTLQSDQFVQFDGTRVDQVLIDDDIKADFENFEAIAGDLLEQFREQARQHREMQQDEHELDEDDFYE